MANLSAFGLLGQPMGETGYEKVMGAIEQGRASDRAQRLGDLQLQTAEAELQAGLGKQERSLAGQEMIEKAMEAYRNGDMKGYQQLLAQASTHLPNESKTLFSLTSGIDKSNAFEASNDVFAAMVNDKATDQEKHAMIQRAVEKIGPNTTAGKNLAELLTKSGDELKLGIANAVKVAQIAGWMPGYSEAQKLGVEEKKLEQREKDREVQLQKLGWEKEEFDLRSKQLHADDRKNLYEGIKAANQAQGDMNQIGSILTLVRERPDLTGGGIYRSIAEKAKQMMGVADEKTAFSKMLQRIRVDQGIQNLPPGVASDKDIELVMSGIPSANMGKDDIQSWLEGRQKTAIAANEYNRAIVNWYKDHPNLVGFQDYWDANGKAAIEKSIKAAGLTFKFREGKQKAETGIQQMTSALDTASKQVGEAIEGAAPAAERVRVKISDLRK